MQPRSLLPSLLGLLLLITGCSSNTTSTSSTSATGGSSGTVSITNSSAPYGVVGQPYSYSLTATGTGAVTWAVSGGSMPAGLMLSSTGLVSGTPLERTPRTFTSNVTATDANGNTAQTALLLNVVGALVVSPALKPVTQSIASASAVIIGGGFGNYTVSLDSGTLPNGLTLGSDGTISGSTTATGSYPIQVTVADSGGASASASSPARETTTANLTLTVMAAGLTIPNFSFPPGVIGALYFAEVWPIGVAPGSSFGCSTSITLGSFPTGINASECAMEGYAKSAQTFTDTITASDIAHSATKAFTVSFGNTLTAGPNNAQLKGSYAFLLQGTSTPLASTPGYVLQRDTIGSLQFDGGNTVTGVIDVVDGTDTTPSAVAVSGSYFVDADRTGVIVLVPSVANPDYTVLRMVLAAPSGSNTVSSTIHLQKFDHDNQKHAANQIAALGDARLQTLPANSTNALSGNYIVGLEGGIHEDPTIGDLPAQIAGLLTADGKGNLTGTVDTYQNDNGLNLNNTVIGSYMLPTAATGRGTLSLTYGTGAAKNFVYYVLSPSQILLMTTGATYISGANVLLAGDAVRQQPIAYSNSSLNGAAIAYSTSELPNPNLATATTTIARLTSSGGNAVGVAVETGFENYASYLPFDSAFSYPVPHNYTIAPNGQMKYSDTTNSPVSLWFYDTDKAYGVGSLSVLENSIFPLSGSALTGLIRMEGQTVPSSFTGNFTVRFAPMAVTDFTETGTAAFSNGVSTELVNKSFDSILIDDATVSTFVLGPDGTLTMQGADEYSGYTYTGIAISASKALVMGPSYISRNNGQIHPIYIYEK